jgi:hypothetical protein
MTLHARASSPAEPGRTSDRTTARAVGVIYLGGMAIGIGGNLLVLSILNGPGHLASMAANSALLAVAAVLWLLTVAGDVAHGVLMFPILKRHGERVAVGYLAARIVDAIFIAVMVLLVLVRVPLGAEYAQADSAGADQLNSLSAVVHHAQLYAYEFAMIAVGVAGLILCAALYRATLIPRPLAVWGLVGYAVLLGGSVLQVLGYELNSVQAMVGGLWEVFIGVWLIVKGFRPASPRPPESSTAAPTVRDLLLSART